MGQWGSKKISNLNRIQSFQKNIRYSFLFSTSLSKTITTLRFPLLINPNLLVKSPIFHPSPSVLILYCGHSSAAPLQPSRAFCYTFTGSLSWAFRTYGINRSGLLWDNTKLHILRNGIPSKKY